MYQPTMPESEQLLIQLVGYLVYAIVLLILLIPFMGRKHPLIFSHWYHLTEGLEISAEDFYNALTLSNVLAVHNAPGGTAPECVRRALRDAKEKLSLYVEVAHACA